MIICTSSNTSKIVSDNKNRLLSFLYILLLYFIISCKPPIQPDWFRINGNTQGTTFSIIYFDTLGIDYKEEIQRLFLRIDESVSLYNSGSVICRINSNDTSVETDTFFREIFNKSMQISEATGGVFDVTVGPLVNAWGFGANDTTVVDSSAIDSIRQLVDYRRIMLVGNKVRKTDPRIRIDFNAIAQGYTVDVIARFFESKNIENYLVEIGGEVKTKGKRMNGESWMVGIDKPVDDPTAFRREIQEVIRLSGKALATSGTYRKFREKNGVRFSHTIDPRTGYPVGHNLLSVSVIADDCTTADAYATAFMVLGPDESLKKVKDIPSLEAYFILSGNGGQFKITYTNEFKNRIIPQNQ